MNHSKDNNFLENGDKGFLGETFVKWWFAERGFWLHYPHITAMDRGTFYKDMEDAVRKMKGMPTGDSFTIDANYFTSMPDFSVSLKKDGTGFARHKYKEDGATTHYFVEVKNGKEARLTPNQRRDFPFILEKGWHIIIAEPEIKISSTKIELKKMNLFELKFSMGRFSYEKKSPTDLLTEMRIL